MKSKPSTHRCAARPCAAEALEHRVLLATISPAGFQDGTYGAATVTPTSMAFAPDRRLFVTEKGGRLRVITRDASGNGTLLPTPFLTVTTNTVSERGLLSVAFDPQFMSNGLVYIYYTATTPALHNRVSRFKAIDVDPGPGYVPGNTFDPAGPDGPGPGGAEHIILELNNVSAGNHNGGAMHFGPDGKLYIATGENAVPSNSQSLGNLLGKMLRINPDGSIPTDNPFYTQASGNNRAIWAVGLRNPYTFAFQPGTGRMFINDVGQSSWEEINDGAPGANYGWPGIEGFRTSQPIPTLGTYRDPVQVYGRSVGITIAGGAFYNPPVANFPAQYIGKYFFADWGSDWIRYIDPSVNRPPITPFAEGANSPVDLDVGPGGALYYLPIDTGQVGRINYVGPRIETQPQSQTVTEGSPATFTVTATGPGTLTYQWRRGIIDIPGATGPSYTLPSAAESDNGARFSVVVRNAATSITSDPATLTVVPAPPAVVGRHVFYNNSAFDGRDPAANQADEGAIANKAALLPGQKASFSNVTSYSRGINGIMIDVENLAASATVGPSNFAFHTGTGEGKWAEAPAPTISLRRGAGPNGSDRITLTWPDGRIVNRWLRVTFIPPSPQAIPINQDVFYFGNLRGETGDSIAPDSVRLTITALDLLRTRRALAARRAVIDNAFDFNRDRAVNVLDYVTVQRYRNRTLTLFTAPPPPT
jgi:glucose/arabinose dehydrogenase